MRKDLTHFARSLRRRQTDAEKKLWARIRNRQIDGWKFNRQVPSGPYVLDFLCFEASLVIEVDGGQHAEERAEHDRIRTAYLEQQGLTVFRVWNNDVLNNIDGVLGHIYEALGARQAPSPGALRRQKSTNDGIERAGLSPRGEAKAKHRDSEVTLTGEKGRPTSGTIPSPLGERARVRGLAASAIKRGKN